MARDDMVQGRENRRECTAVMGWDALYLWIFLSVGADGVVGYQDFLYCISNTSSCHGTWFQPAIGLVFIKNQVREPAEVLCLTLLSSF